MSLYLTILIEIFACCEAMDIYVFNLLNNFDEYDLSYIYIWSSYPLSVLMNYYD